MKTKENLLIKYIFCIVAFVAFFVFGVACVFSSSLVAHAEEAFFYSLENPIFMSTSTTYKKGVYDYLATHTSVDVSNEAKSYCFILREDLSTDNMNYYDLRVYNYESDSFNGASISVQRFVSYADGEEINDITNLSSARTGFWENSTNHTNAEGTFTTNIPMFNNYEDARNFMKTGDDSGQINKSESVNDETLYLVGFSCDNSIYATWTGLAHSGYVDLNNVSVEVVPSCFLILESGETEQDFDLPDTQVVPYTDFCFSKAYSDYVANNPYEGRLQLILTFVPSYYNEETNQIQKGQKIVVMFDEKGNIKDLDLPEGTAEDGFDNEFYLKNFTATSEFHNWSDSYIHCLWNGSSVDGVVDYTYSEVKIEIYARKGKYPDTSYEWIEYDTGDIVSIRSNRFTFNLSDVDDFCREFGYRIYDSTYNWENIKFRLTPYYKTSSHYINGRSVQIALSSLAGIDSIMESEGDATKDDNVGWDDLDDDYVSDGSPIDDLLDDVFNDKDGGEDGFDLADLPVKFIAMLKGFISACGAFPSLVASIFSFLPSQYTNMLVIGLGLVILLRILGR